MQTDVDLGRLDRAILNAFQGGFPVCARPFEPASAALRERGIDLSASAMLERLQSLDESGTISRFGALVNAEEIGGTATLVAMHAPADRFDEVVEEVNSHREVAHNYEREHDHLNVWFVVSVADVDAVARVLTAIEDATGQETYNMPKQREFHVGAKFLLDGPISDGGVDLSELGPTVEATAAERISPGERDLIVELQDGLPLSATPYADLAASIDRSPDWVRETIKRFLLEGKVRRVGVIPNHYALGYTVNGMTVWNIPDEKVEAVGEAVAAFEFVTHCYERPRHDGVWPYNFFAMTHGRSTEESDRRVAEIRDRISDHCELSAADWDTLFSTEILKKTGIRLRERADANTA